MCKYCDLVFNLVIKEIRVRYMGTIIGFAWSLANPLVTTLTYVFVFTYMFPSGQPHYALFMIVGFLHWNLFSQVVGASSDVLVSNSGLLQKIYFPRYLVPLASVLVKVLLWFSSFVVFALAYLFIGGQLSWPLAIIPLYFVLSVMFIYGAALILSVLYVDYRDIKHLIEVGLQVLFWMTPILYSIDKVPHTVAIIMKATPVAEFILISQDIFYLGKWPDPYVALGFLLWTTLFFIGGITMFKKRVPLLIERL